MFGHLKPQKFIALIDGEALSERDNSHLENCAHCQSRRRELESLYTSVAGDEGDVSEPDWEHFRGYVRTELLSRSVRRQTASTIWGLRPSMGWALSIVMAVVVTAAVFTFSTEQPNLPGAVETTVEFTPAASTGSLIEVQGLEAEFNVWSHTTVFEEIAGLESSEAAQLLELLENQNGASPAQ